jgi:hypothetical protein
MIEDFYDEHGITPSNTELAAVNALLDAYKAGESH